MSDGVARSSRNTRVIEDPAILEGTPVLDGTRIPAATIAAYLRDGYSTSDIRKDYPSLPTDGIAVVETWARETYGPGWRRKESPTSS